MNVIYFPGFLSVPKPDVSKVQLFRDLGHDVHIVDTKQEYTVRAYKDATIKLISGVLKNRLDDMLYVGTSLGGFWARVFGHVTVSPWIGLNPSVVPSETLKKYIGSVEVYGSGKKLKWAQTDCDAYKLVEDVTPMRSRVPGLVIAAKDDNVINPMSAQILSAIQFELLQTGGHRLKNVDDYKSLVEIFIQYAVLPPVPANFTSGRRDGANLG